MRKKTKNKPDREIIRKSHLDLAKETAEELETAMFLASSYFEAVANDDAGCRALIELDILRCYPEDGDDYVHLASLEDPERTARFADLLSRLLDETQHDFSQSIAAMKSDIEEWGKKCTETK